ncbi:hypothetical protein H5410_023181 [Solanum commersonii]|uniref:Uncharacterized protein n=1 Tax=Solanum commersonii TaxID=4109 RepID=A0A9J5ZJ84_SOLCO|nr:hypothetical protein H5410_023181 [Solanum commersonii]
MHSAIRPLVCFITFQLLPSTYSRFGSLGDIVLLRGTVRRRAQLKRPTSDSNIGEGSPKNPMKPQCQDSNLTNSSVPELKIMACGNVSGLRIRVVIIASRPRTVAKLKELCQGLKQ